MNTSDSVTSLTVATIKKLAMGDAFTLPVLVKSSKEGTSRNGGKFVTVVFGDASGEFVSTLFPNNTALPLIECNVGKGILLSGVAEEFNNAFRPKVTYVRPLNTDEVEGLGSRLRFSGPFSPAVLEERINEAIQAIQSVELRQTVDLLFKTRREAFFHLPAAVYHHHAYATGLAEHTCSLVGLARNLAGPGGAYAHHKLDLDIITAGLLIHDLGKVEEYRGVETFEFVPESRLIGHICYALVWFTNMCLACKVPKDLARAVSHVVLSHHGELEHGSPVKPCTPEAVFVHNLDRLDSQMGKLYMARNGFETDMKLVVPTH